jgi:hypothetical protein
MKVERRQQKTPPLEEPSVGREESAEDERPTLRDNRYPHAVVTKYSGFFA